MQIKKNNDFRKVISRIDKSIQNPQNIAELAALLYQENSKLSKFTIMQQGENIGRFSNPYILQRASQPYKCFPTHKVIPMKEYGDINPPVVDLFNVIRVRKSIREYENYSISTNELHSILFYCYGITRLESIKGAKGKWAYRSVPSGGALYPLEIYVYLNNGVLPKGIYHYRPDLDAIEVVTEKDYLSELQEFIVAEPYVNIKDSSCVVFISSITQRVLLKYGERGYRFILQEVGFACQNISLVCTAIDLGSCMIGSFVDDKINEIIRADGTLETIQGIIVIGKEKKLSNNESDS